MEQSGSRPPHRGACGAAVGGPSGDPTQEYFADGMTEGLITDLSKIRELKVISRTSSQRYRGTSKALPEIARGLNVDAIIEGSVLQSGDQVRITAQLIEADTDRHLWADNYERHLRDVLALQRDVAQAIAGEIRVRVTTRSRRDMPRSARWIRARMKRISAEGQRRTVQRAWPAARDRVLRTGASHRRRVPRPPTQAWRAHMPFSAVSWDSRHRPRTSPERAPQRRRRYSSTARWRRRMPPSRTST